MAQRIFGYLGRYKGEGLGTAGRARPDWLGELTLAGELYRAQVWIRQGEDGEKAAGEKEAVLKLTSCRRERLIRDKYLTLAKAAKGYAATGHLGRNRYRVKMAPFPLPIADVQSKPERTIMVLVIERVAVKKAA